MDLIHNGTEQHTNAQADTPSATNGHATEPVKSAEVPLQVAWDPKDILPERLLSVCLKDTTAEAAIAELQRTRGWGRAAMLFVEARGVPDETIRSWLQHIDRLSAAQKDVEDPERINLQTVVFLPANHTLETLAEWYGHPFVYLIATDEQGPLPDVYREILRQDIAALFLANPREGLTPISELKDEEKGIPILEYLTGQDRERYKWFLRQHGYQVD